MKRLHVNLSVADLAVSIKFYSGLFGAPPSVLKPDYAKWMLDDPRVNFAIATRGKATGVDHLGIQAEDAGELRDIYGRLKAAEGEVIEQGAVTCCYAQSEKSWVLDPQGIAWEAFLTHGEATVYGDGGAAPMLAVARGNCGAPAPAAKACCAPATTAEVRP